MTELYAESPQLGPAQDGLVGADRTLAHGNAQKLQMGMIMPELLQRLGKRQRLTNLILNGIDRVVPAEVKAAQRASPTAEPLTDKVTILKQVGAPYYGAQFLSVPGVRGRHGLIEGVLMLE